MSKKVVVALLTRDQEFQLLQAADAEAAAQHHGFEIEVLFAGNSVIGQVQQLLPFVHAPAAKRPAAILIEPVTGEALERIAREAVAAGVGWILMNRRAPYLLKLRGEYPTVAISSVSLDHLEIGRIQARQIRALAPEGGTVLYIQGPPDTSTSQERLAGAREVLAGASIDLRVYAGQWTEESGYKAAIGWLRPRVDDSSRPRAVVAQNDSMAIGARKAFVELRPGWVQVPFIGCDGLPEGGQRLVKLRQLAATVITQSNSGPAMELVSSWLRTGTLPPAQELLTARSCPDLETLTRSGTR